MRPIQIISAHPWGVVSAFWGSEWDTRPDQFGRQLRNSNAMGGVDSPQDRNGKGEQKINSRTMHKINERPITNK